MVHLTDEDIISRLTAVEDGTTERKSASDYRDWVKTVVAFSNSLAIDQPGILYINVFDNGVIQEQPQDFERLQKKVTGEISNIFPPVNPTILVREKDGRQFIAVIVYGSRERPHFAGKSYTRSGTQTLDASEENLRQFIAQRSSKVTEILKWKGQTVIVAYLNPEETRYRVSRVSSRSAYVVDDCNAHWVTFRDLAMPPQRTAVSLLRVELSFDHKEECLILEVSRW